MKALITGGAGFIGLAENAQEVARKRHDYAVVSNDLLAIYQATISYMPFSAGAD